MLSETQIRLKRISHANVRTIRTFEEGISHVNELACTLDEAVDKSVFDRLLLADEFLRMADQLLRARRQVSRAAIARYYYAMYHAMRAASFQYFRGDDHQEHSALSSKGVPPDYPDAASVRNALNDARVVRNDADYEQYPSDPAYWRAEARRLRPQAHALVVGARRYVNEKGNRFA